MNDGGSAFPNNSDGPNYDGMSLRDYFATNAPEDIYRFISFPHDASIEEKMELVAKLNYVYADAMLKEREKKQ